MSRLACAATMNVSPIIKWAGSKRQLKEVILKEIDRLHPDLIQTYYEPFAGGLSVYFALTAAGRINHAELSDVNEELITLYQVVQKDPKPLIRHLKRLTKEQGFSEEAYYAIRASAPKSPAAIAARMMYINRVGFNGLYRVNKKGECNVPYGHWQKYAKSPPVILDEAALTAAHHAFKRAHIFHSTATHVIDAWIAAGAQGFMYLDPPYWPTRPTANFTSYSAEGFGQAGQEQLAYDFGRLTRGGYLALLSNSDVPDTRALYKGFRSKKVRASRSINSDGAKRGKVSELLVESRFKQGYE